jgi:hypothetical protein
MAQGKPQSAAALAATRWSLWPLEAYSLAHTCAA